MNATGLFVIGATHQRTPLAIREKLSLNAAGKEALHAQLAAIEGLREFAVLSTCNRIEFYGVGARADAAARVAAAFCAQQHFDLGDFQQVSLDLSGRAAVQHLVEVSAGLDSQMLGET